ncbi:MAG: prolipoprotein diacylglyceryl transferase [Thiohalomonadales bacterium]
MFTFPEIDPVALDLGPVQIHWYGLMYLVAFAAAWWLGNMRAKRPNAIINTEQVSDLIFYGALGVVLGGRIGYVIFYNFDKFLNDPVMLFRVWEGGMSFHGGFLGVALAMWIYSRKLDISFAALLDFVVPLVPIGLGTGRLGNFINSELWGRVTDSPLGIVFPNGGALPRHPSQLYEFALEGVVLFLILWFFSAKPRPRLAVAGVFAVGYGTFRFTVEFFRQPDAHIGFLAFDWLTMGMLLSTPMIVLGVALLWWAYFKNNSKDADTKLGHSASTRH